MRRAILNAVRSAETAYGLPCAREMDGMLKKGRPLNGRAVSGAPVAARRGPGVP